jgi:hypothetical protein
MEHLARVEDLVVQAVKVQVEHLAVLAVVATQAVVARPVEDLAEDVRNRLVMAGW